MTDHYLIAIDGQVTLHGQEFHVRTHWAQVDGRPTVVGVDLRSFQVEERSIAEALVPPEPVGGQWSEVTSPVVRALRIGSVAEGHRLEFMESYDVDIEERPESERGQLEADQAFWGTEPDRKKPGPAEQMTDDLLRSVVEPAYRRGGRKPVVAVQEALEAAGYPGSAWDPKKRRNVVSPNQASAAVRKARAKGLLGPVKGKKK